MKRILIVGAGANQIGLITKAEAMGLFAIAADGDPAAAGLALAGAQAVVNITDADALTAVAREHQADAIYPAAEAGVLASAIAAGRLGLPGVSPETARYMRDKLAMRQALEAAGVANVPYRAVKSVSEAEAAAAELGLPVIVKPADGNASKGVRQVDYIEDMVLAFNTAFPRSASGTVMVEDYVEGAEYNVDGLVYEGKYRLGGITGKDVSPLPFRFDMGIYMPPMLDAATENLIEATVAEALRAVGFHTGTSHVEVILSPDGPRIVEMAGRPGGGRIPTDLIPLTYGLDYVADAFRIVLGEAPREQRRFERGTAVYWLETRSGVVTQVTGIEDAKALPGVRDVVVPAKPGDIMQHIVDCATRDRVGYVLVEADSAEEAQARALTTRAAVTIHVDPTASD
jgi:biotin carboxylase